MMSKDSVRTRMESESGISYTEFTYQLLQGYDFLHLYKEHGVQVRWGNDSSTPLCNFFLMVFSFFFSRTVSTMKEMALFSQTQNNKRPFSLLFFVLSFVYTSQPGIIAKKS